MIIKNPYSTIAKYYRIINFILLVPLVYLLLKYGDIAEFYRDYVRAGYSTPETNFVDTYVTGLTFLVPVVLIIVNLGIYFVFLSKKKKQSYHLLVPAYCVVLLILDLLFHTTMTTIQNGGLDPTFANFVRDCANLCPLPLYAFIVIGISKCFGFNLKTLKFDIKDELKITDEEEDDIELKIGDENNSVKKQAVHLIRELKYYILENKFVFTCFSVVFGLAIVGSIILKFQVYNKTYYTNQSFSLSNFTLSLKESYISNVDYHGNIISRDKYFLIVKMGIINNGQARVIDRGSFRISVNGENLYPNYERALRFLDIGKPYQGEEIPKQSEENPGEEYVLVYELTKDQVKSSYQMKILTDLTQKEGHLVTRYKTINIKPTNIVKGEKIGTGKLNTELKFKDTVLGDTTYKLKSYKLDVSYQYEAQNCSNGQCTMIRDRVVPSGGKYLFIIEDELKLDENTQYYKNSPHDFYNDFMSVDYIYSPSNGTVKNDEIHNISAIKDVTPRGVTNVKIFEVPSTIRFSTKINLVITIRNKQMVIELK